jgi:UDP-N-acetylmuramyl pentapeptide phosphotransferase/UDP-N-acetylglucosamine-1-phosphate transferase
VIHSFLSSILFEIHVWLWWNMGIAQVFHGNWGSDLGNMFVHFIQGLWTTWTKYQ